MSATKDLGMSDQFWSIAAGSALVYGLLLVVSGAGGANSEASTPPPNSVVRNGDSAEVSTGILEAFAYTPSRSAQLDNRDESTLDR